MFGDVLLFENDGIKPVRAERLAFGETAGRNEAWLRDTLFAYPELLPLRDIDPSFGPLIPLCKELRTAAGPIDIAFINSFGQLTLIECKLWRNPEARRKVIAQALDYARAISRWSYSDLQRQVAAATGTHGNVPFELARTQNPTLVEQRFVDDTARAMRAGRFLLVIAGDGIREDVSSIAELINRNAASAFSFGLVEVALYGFDNASLAVQARVIARTQIIERTVVVVRDNGGAGVVEIADEAEAAYVAANGKADANQPANDLGESPKQAAYRAWWTPVIQSEFDDPDQEPAKLYYPNNVRASLPWPTKVWASAFRLGGETGVVGIFTNGKEPGYSEMLSLLSDQMQTICSELPPGTTFRKFNTADTYTLSTQRSVSEFTDDSEMRSWLASTLNAYVNALRPRLKAIMPTTGRPV